MTATVTGGTTATGIAAGGTAPARRRLVVLALAMAVGCVWAASRRLAEHR